jgi:hypothetical protein
MSVSLPALDEIMVDREVTDEERDGIPEDESPGLFSQGSTPVWREPTASGLRVSPRIFLSKVTVS